MNKKLDKIIAFLVIFYLFFNMFNGIIKKIVFNIKPLLKLTPYVGEVLIILIIVAVILKKKKFEINYIFMMIFYYLMVAIGSFYNLREFDELLYNIKAFILPLILFYVSSDIKLNIKSKIILKKYLKLIFRGYLISGFILGTIQRYLDWEWTSKFYTGYSFYSIDPITKIRIWHAGGYLRVPSLTGNSVSFAMFSTMLVIYFLFSKDRYKWFYIILAIMNTYISTNKTNFGCGIILLLYYFYQNRKKNTKSLMIITIISLVTLSPLMINFNAKVLGSMKERLNYWEIILDRSWKDMLIPIDFYKYSSASKFGFESVMDNSYLFILFSTGILGFVLFGIFLYRINKETKNQQIKYFIVYMLIYATTTNIFQGVSVMAIFSIFFIVYNNQKLFKKLKRTKI